MFRPRIIVRDILKKLDPEGTEIRKKHRFREDECIEILDPITLGISMDIMILDGFSRKILWLTTRPTILLICISLR